VPLPLLELADVGVSVPVEDRDRPPGAHVAEEVAEGRLVAAAEHDHHDVALERVRHQRREALLIGLEHARDRDVAVVLGVLEQIDERLAGAGVRREARQVATDLGGRGGGARAAVVAAHALVGREADEHGARGGALRHLAPDEVPEPRIVRRRVRRA
jgi:hypothetical protein